MVKYHDKIKEIKEIGLNAYNLSLKTLEYSCDIYLEHSNYLRKKDPFHVFLMKQNLHWIIEHRNNLYILKKRLLPYTNDVDSAVQKEAIEHLNLVNTCIDTCWDSILRVKNTFGEEFKEENITPLFRQVENKSFFKDKIKSIALIVFIIFMIIGFFCFFF